jgi:hypothetical protein
MFLLAANLKVRTAYYPPPKSQDQFVGILARWVKEKIGLFSERFG